MKEVRLESGPKRMNGVCLPDAPGQIIPLERDDRDISERSLAISLCVTVLGPRNIEK